MYAMPGMKYPAPKLTGCNVPDCYHYITLFAAKGEPKKCLCSSTAKGRTGEVGCPGDERGRVENEGDKIPR